MLYPELHGPIRIFEIGHHLDSALECPTTGPRAPMAFRFLPDYGPAGFRCCDCGAVRMFDLSGKSCGTGYARVDGNQLCCYACTDARQREEMRKRPARFGAYISRNGRNLTTWSGGILGNVVNESHHRNNWGAWIHCYTIRDVHGKYWHGRNAGPNMCIVVRPSKGG